MLSISSFCQSPQPPAELSFLSTWGEVRERYPYESWGEFTFPAYGEHQVNKTGRHWNLLLAVPGTKDRAAAWAIVKPVALKSGWTVLSENPGGGLLIVMRYNHDGTDAWLNIAVDDSTSPPTLAMDLVEVAPPPISLTLAEPAATPEKMADDSGDFPYLAPLPGSESHGGQKDNAPLLVTPKGSDQPEVVANGSLLRSYKLKDLSQVLFAAVYRDALTKAGWDIVQETNNGEVTVAHYSKRGRNLWASLLDHAEEYQLRVGIEAAPDALKASLAANCHVALYGVLFDFNKSTLQPASAGPLQQVAALMAANPSLHVQIKGHTDNIGSDAYNQTLSEARARAVMAWLTQHGVAPDRMTAKGYGKTMPIADNNTDEGRMKNRRVEIADPQCKSQGK